MTKTVVIKKVGGPEVMEYVSSDLRNPKQGEVLVRHKAIGLNRYDVEFRTGARKSKSLPVVLGVEAVGIVEKLGPGVEAVSVGDRVGYCTASGGAYSEARIIPQKFLLKISDDISDELAAAVLLKGMTAHYLTHRVYDVRPGTFALVYGVTGGVGQILCQWARYKGCKVIGAISTNNYFDVAKQVGCAYVLNYNDSDFVKEVAGITGGKGVNVVYDPVGQAVSKSAFASLGVFGLYVSYGQVSGPITGISTSMLNSRSWFISAPDIHHYKRSRLELGLTAMEIFEMLRQGHICSSVNKVYKFNEIPKAHKDLESRKLVGSSIIVF